MNRPPTSPSQGPQPPTPSGAPAPPQGAPTARRTTSQWIQIGRETPDDDLLARLSRAPEEYSQALIACGWLLERLERDLLAAARRLAVPIKPRVGILLRLLGRPALRDSTPDFVGAVCRMRRAQRRRRARWLESSPAERNQLNAEVNLAEDAVDALLGRLTRGGA